MIRALVLVLSGVEAIAPATRRGFGNGRPMMMISAVPGTLGGDQSAPKREFHAINRAFPGLRQVHNDPDVFVVDDFLSPDYCRTLIEAATSSNSGGTADEQLRRSSQPVAQLDLGIDRMWPLIPLVLLSAAPSYLRALDLGDDPVGACLRAWTLASGVVASLALAVPRILQATTPQTRTSCSALMANQTLTDELLGKAEQLLQAPCTTFEAPVVTRYTAGQRFVAHNDASLSPEKDWSDLGGQRLVTLICYLNDVPRGGRTVFTQITEGGSSDARLRMGANAGTESKEFGGDPDPNSDSSFAIAPRAGSLLVFFPASRDGKVDERTEHYAEAAVDEKLICQLWKRQRIVPPPLGPQPRAPV